MRKFRDYLSEQSEKSNLQTGFGRTGLLTEASFKIEDLKKVASNIGSLLGKGLGGAFKVWTTENFERDNERGQGVRLLNAKGYGLRLNFSDKINGFANNKSVVLSSVDFWEAGNVDLECPDVTCRFNQEVNIIQIWNKLSDIIFNKKYGKYTAGDLGAEPVNEDIAKGSIRTRKDFLASKGIAQWRGEVRRQFDSAIVQGGYEAEWNAYVAQVEPGRPETNSTEERMKRAETKLKETKYADPDVIFKDLVTLTKMFKSGKRKLLTVCGQGGLGKCIDVDTLIATPNGYLRAGDIKVGDTVFTHKNTVANVLEVYPQSQKKECYKVTLSDGRSVIADEEQLFNVKINTLSQGSNAGRFKNVMLKDIIEAFNEQKNQLISEGKWDCSNPKSTHIFFPVPEAVEYEKKDVEIDPYMLGLLIGDGGMTAGVSFSNNDENTINWLKEHIEKEYPGFSLKYASGVDYNITRDNYNPKGKTMDESRNIIKSKLKALGLMGANSFTKFIPDVYKFNDIETRMELIRGLMDTDGYIASKGNSSYCTASERLANDFAEIIRSLGGKARIFVKNITYKDSVKHYFDVNFVLPFKMGSVVKNNALKVERYNKRLSGKEFFKKLTVADIQPVGLRDTICFLIDDPDHLFVTSEFMVVHNTFEIYHTLSDMFGASPNKEWIYIPAGKFTTLQFYQEVFMARDRIICFDEADNLVKNDQIVTMLKPALDTSGDNQFTYNTGTKRMTDMSKKQVEEYCELCDDALDQGVPFAIGKRFGKKDNIIGYEGYNEEDPATGVWLPSRFFFTGKMILISNLPLKEIDSALRTRGPAMDITLTLQGKIKRIETVLKNMGHSPDTVAEIIEQLEKQDDPELISIRTAVAYIDFMASGFVTRQEAARLSACYG